MLILGPRQQQLWFSAQVDGRNNKTNGQGAERQQRLSNLRNEGGSVIELGFQAVFSNLTNQPVYSGQCLCLFSVFYLVLPNCIQFKG